MGGCLDVGGDGEHAPAGGLQRRPGGRVPAVERVGGRGPQVGEHDHPVGGGGQGGELLACRAGRFDQPDRGGDQESITAAGKALIVVVDRLVVVTARVGEQR